MEMATSMALRHSMNTSDTSTTIAIASIRLRLKLWILSRTSSGSLLVRSMRRSGGSTCFRSATAAFMSRS
jgi:hypothetical protein